MIALTDPTELLATMLAAAAGDRDGDAGRIAGLTEHAGSARLGWLVPPGENTLTAAAETILGSYSQRPRRLCVVGTGGWAFAARAIVEATGTDRVLAVDLPVRAELDALPEPVSCLSVSASGTTLETSAITTALAERSVPIRCLRDRELSARGVAEHTAMFGAPLSTAFAVPAMLADPAATTRGYRELATGYPELALDAVRTACQVTDRATVALPAWAGAGTRLWLRQLAHQALGGKIGATVASVEFAPSAEATVNYTGSAADLAGLIALFYHFGVFVAALGLRQGLPICSETNVHHYKDLLGAVGPEWPADTIALEAGRLGSSIEHWAAGRPVDVLAYRPLPELTLPGQVHTGPRWNHHSFQSGYADPEQRVAIVAGPATDPLAATRRRIAVATHQSLRPRSALFALTDK